MNGSQALCVNQGGFICNSGISLSPASKNLFIILFILYFKTKEGQTKEFNLKGVLIPKLLNYLLASRSLRNFDFLLLHTEQFDKSIILPFFVFATS